MKDRVNYKAIAEVMNDDSVEFSFKEKLISPLSPFDALAVGLAMAKLLLVSSESVSFEEV